jgi:ABC-type lipoprotein export system ATPase subunit
LEEFTRICAEENVAVVTVTHDPLVSDYANREISLVDGVIGSD